MNDMKRLFILTCAGLSLLTLVTLALSQSPARHTLAAAARLLLTATPDAYPAPAAPRQNSVDPIGETAPDRAVVTDTYTAYLPLTFLQYKDYPDPHDTGFNCRYGTAAWTYAQLKPLFLLHAGWYLTFNTRTALAHWNTEYVPVVRIKQDRDADGYRLPTVSVTPPLTDDGLGVLVDSRPGALWFVGNEPDRVYWQDDTMPDAYARVYHDIYHFIKQRDPTAQVGIAGLVEVTPGRLQYLDIIWRTYADTYGTTIPVDVWNMHLYILPEVKVDGSGSRAAVALGTDKGLAILENETGKPDICPRDDVYCYAEHDDMAIFIQQVVWMRTWMKEHGQQNKPLVLSEYSTLYPYEIDDPHDPNKCYLRDENGNCFTPERVGQFMEATFQYLETATDPALGYPLDGNRLIQQWLWFAVDEGTEGSSNRLVDSRTQEMTLLGETYRDHVEGIPRKVNLMPAQTVNRTPFTPADTDPPEIGVIVRNNGNLDLRDTDFRVTFYSDAARTMPIGSAVILALPGCARRPELAMVPWPDASPGFHYYWYKIDSLNQVSESSEADNTGRGMIIVRPQQLFLPVVNR